MRFLLQRLYNTARLTTGNYTCGFLSNQEQTFRSFVLEDDFNAEKIKGVTRIPEGFYQLALRDFVNNTLIRHRVSLGTLPWFKANPNWHHIEVTKVPNYGGILVHAVGDDKDTEGCIGPGYAFDMTLADNQQWKSKLAVNDFYQIVHPLLLGGGKASLEIKNEYQYG